MRGKIAIDLEVPSQGLVANLPPHKVPNGGLLPGSSNTFVDLDGLAKTRRGYSVIASVADRPIGIVSYFDFNLAYQQVVQTLTKWYHYDPSTITFTNITGTPNNGSANILGRWAVLPNNNLMWLYGCNGVDAIRAWRVGLAAYITPTSTNIPSSCQDMTVLNNRLVVVNTVESGTNFFYRVRWSPVNDGGAVTNTTWPVLGFADLVDNAEPNIAIVNTSRTSAVIYRTTSAWSINAIGGGSDNFAFSFERIPVADHMNGPASASAVVRAEGLQYYLGLDGRVYAFDGIGIYPISAPIDATFGPQFNLGFSSRAHGVYLPSQRCVWWFAPTSGNDPTTGICYNLVRQIFEPLATFADTISCSAETVEQQGVTWLNWVPASYSWPQVPYASWSSIPSSTSLNDWIGLVNGKMERFFTALTDDGVAIPYTMIFPQFRPSSKVGINVSHVELYLQQASSPEALTAVLQGFFQPMWNSPVNIVNIAIELADQTTFALRLEPGGTNPMNLKSNLLQLILSSAGNQAGLVFAGGAIFVDQEERGDYLPLQGAYPAAEGQHN